MPHRMELLGGQARDPMLPQGVGHYWMDERSERKVLHGLGGPVRWPLFDDQEGALEDVYVYDRKGPPGHLGFGDLGASGQEWGGQGTGSRLRAVDRGGHQGYGRPHGHELAHGWRLHPLDGSARCEGWNGQRVQGAEAMAQILVWLRRWKRGELRCAGTLVSDVGHAVSRWVEAWWIDALEGNVSDEGEENQFEGVYAGGRRRKKIEEVIGNKAVEVLLQPPRPFDGQVASRVEEWLEENLMGDKAPSTEKAYAGSWAKWKAWAKRQGWPSEYLSRKGDPVQNENYVLSFIGYLGWLGASSATIRQARDQG